MGYRCNLKADKEFKQSDVQEVLDSLPDKYRGKFNCKESSWGWSCGCDVYFPEGNELGIGGSYGISGDIAEGFVDYVLKELEKKGYNIKSNWCY